jgi:hypothetical protein
MIVSQSFITFYFRNIRKLLIIAVVITTDSQVIGFLRLTAVYNLKREGPIILCTEKRTMY